jgi:hypothetical protein
MKTNYAAHIIMAVRYRSGTQNRFPCYENVVLIEADDPDEAMRRAEEYGAEEARHDDPTFTWGGQPAYWQFAGVRKLIECRTLGDPEDRLRDGTELTYSQLEVSSEKDLKKLVEGEPVSVTYEE